MITPDSPDRVYSTRLRTALVLTGSGTAGAYHAGVLRALHEAGIRIDLVAGRGIGAATAMFAAVDGGPRLWEANGIWRAGDIAGSYGWRAPLRGAGWGLAAAAAILAVPLLLLAIAVLVGVSGLLLTLVGLESSGATLTAGFSRWIATLFSPDALPTVVPRLVLFAILVSAAMLLGASLSPAVGRNRRRRARGLAWRLLGAPLSAASARARVESELWQLIRGAAPASAPEGAELARRYVELLLENVGQPGFRELLITAHDLDARRDLVFALLGDAQRSRFFARPAAGDNAARLAEAFDLGGVARDHVVDALAAGLAVPLATEPHLITFSPEGPWRGETHRLCDRPAALARLLEEVAIAGAEQVILLSASPPPARAHELSAGRGDLRGRAGEQLAGSETAALRDVLEHFGGKFAGLFVVRPAHNPLGPLDFGGVYDERSDRRHTLAELVDRGYEDAYRQFIDPVVGASGDRIEARPSLAR
ncbi:MAG TPA: patatin-like phospholipase family protein [Vicinamibacterales bacterium]|nr:patatin-like phospholipase family protein [Vicinamibacterales bacterium]